MDHVIHADVRKTQGTVIIVELECADARGVSLEGEHEDVAHQSHVLHDILRIPVLRARHVGLGERGPPALQFAAAAGALDPLFHFADGVQIFVELLLILPADVAPKIFGIAQYSIKYAAVAGLGFIFKQPIKRQRRIHLQRRGCVRAAP